MKEISKQCTRCGEVKSLSEFYKHKYARDGYHSWCKECCKEYGKKMYKQNYRAKPIKPRICKICDKEFIPSNNCQKYCSKKCVKIAEKNWEEKYKEERKKYKRKWLKGHPEYGKQRRKKHEKEYKEYGKIWRKKHKEECREYAKKWVKLRKREDINFKLACNLRDGANKALKYNWKTGHTLELLGCSIDYLRKYLEKLFKKGMTWKNWGRGWQGKKEWHIDHIRPISSFDMSKKSEQLKCFNYKNLQPLWAKENLSKGSKTC